MPATAPAGPDERPAAAAVAAATRVPAGGPPSRASRRPELDVMRALVVAGITPPTADGVGQRSQDAHGSSRTGATSAPAVLYLPGLAYPWCSSAGRQAGLPASIQRAKMSIFSWGQAPSQGMVPACSRPSMVAARWLTSACDHKSKAKLVDCRSRRRNSGLMCCPKRASPPHGPCRPAARLAPRQPARLRSRGRRTSCRSSPSPRS